MAHHQKFWASASQMRH